MSGETVHISIVGLPASGKTTFLAALWHMVREAGAVTALSFEQLSDGNYEHLNALAKLWRQGKIQQRTQLAGIESIRRLLRARSDATAPAVDALFARLRSLGIETVTVTHPAVYTVEQAKAHRVRHDGTHVKNLFLRNKKGAMWLVVLQEERTIDLKDLGRCIGAGNVSFGSPERLRRYLGVEPGSVTPFAVVNDADAKVQVVIDARVLQRDPVQCHPLTNTMTTAISGADLLHFLRACGHTPRILDVDALSGS